MSIALLPSPQEARHAALWQAAQALEGVATLIRVLADEASAPQVNADELLTVGEAAKVLRRSQSFVRGRCRTRKIIAIRDGKDWRIRRAALADYERRRTFR